MKIIRCVVGAGSLFAILSLHGCGGNPDPSTKNPAEEELSTTSGSGVITEITTTAVNQTTTALTNASTTTSTALTNASTTTSTQQGPSRKDSRGKRLCDGDLMVLYHQTDMAACTNILKTGFDLGRASVGNQGKSVYFADDAATTGFKTRHMGCVIKLLARVGKIFDMENAWLPDMVPPRKEEGCDAMFGYELMHDGYDSVTTIKHGRERALFFTDQILDMVACPTATNWGNNGQCIGDYLNGRSELKEVDSCNEDDYPEYKPPTCKFDGSVQDKACAGFTSAGCYTKPDGNVDDGAICEGPVLSTKGLDWNSCQKDCYDQPQCKGFQFAGNQCVQYSAVPTAKQALNSGTNCMKKVGADDSEMNFVMV